LIIKILLWKYVFARAFWESLHCNGNRTSCLQSFTFVQILSRLFYTYSSNCLSDDGKHFSMYLYIFVQFYVIYTHLLFFFWTIKGIVNRLLCLSFSLKNLFETLMLEDIKLANSCKFWQFLWIICIHYAYIIYELQGSKLLVV